jgi:hypothetical protein
MTKYDEYKKKYNRIQLRAACRELSITQYAPGNEKETLIARLMKWEEENEPRRFKDYIPPKASERHEGDIDDEDRLTKNNQDTALTTHLSPSKDQTANGMVDKGITRSRPAENSTNSFRPTRNSSRRQDHIAQMCGESDNNNFTETPVVQHTRSATSQPSQLEKNQTTGLPADEADAVPGKICSSRQGLNTPTKHLTRSAAAASAGVGHPEVSEEAQKDPNEGSSKITRSGKKLVDYLPSEDEYEVKLPMRYLNSAYRMRRAKEQAKEDEARGEVYGGEKTEYRWTRHI